MSNNNHSINEFDFNLICEYFSSTERQGPGSEEATLKALQLLETLPVHPRIADLGCGTGSSALLLAKHTQGDIVALDLFPQFLEKLQSRAEQQGVSKRVTTIIGSMDSLPFAESSFDAIWSEEAIYNVGFMRGVHEWFRFIKPGGYLAVTDASWLTDNRPKEIEEFWLDAYPEIDTIANKTKQMAQAGYKDIHTFVLPDNCWETNFYQPQREAQRLFLQRHPNNLTAQELVRNQQREAILYSQYKHYYGYVFYIGRK